MSCGQRGRIVQEEHTARHHPNSEAQWREHQYVLFFGAFELGQLDTVEEEINSQVYEVILREVKQNEKHL